MAQTSVTPQPHAWPHKVGGAMGLGGRCSWDCGACCTQEVQMTQRGFPPPHQGFVAQLRLQPMVLSGILILGSPEGSLGAALHGEKQQLWFAAGWAEGCRASHHPPPGLGQLQPPCPGSRRAACRFGGHQDTAFIFIAHDWGIDPSKEGLSAQLVAAGFARFGVFAVVVIVLKCECRQGRVWVGHWCFLRQRWAGSARNRRQLGGKRAPMPFPAGLSSGGWGEGGGGGLGVIFFPRSCDI